MVLVELQNDLATIIKSKTLPFTQSYNLSPDASFGITIKQLEDGNFHLELKSPNGCEVVTEPKLKRLVEFAHMYTWRALASSLSRISLAPCATMAHSGADEILALYQCLHAFRTNVDLPYIFSLDGPRGPYELFSVKQKGTQCEITIETNYVYGNSMKWRAEVEFAHQVVERAEKIVADYLGEWLRPGGSSIRADLDRELHPPASRPRPPVV